jgi:hypothetical protein
VVFIRPIVCTEEDGSCKHSLESLDYSPIVASVLGQIKKVEHLSGATKPYSATLLLHGERGYPDWD